MSWFVPSIKNPARLIEVGSFSPDPVDVYKDRYRDVRAAVDQNETVLRVWDQIFSEFENNSSVLLFGSGHSFWANSFNKFPNVAKTAVLDYVGEASLGLDTGIDFFCRDILSEDISDLSFDYVYSAHTVEHFSRDEIFNIVLPKCLSVANKAVVFLVPYGMNWSEEPSHKCRFYENDELAALSSKYKTIRDGVELVLWFNKQDGN